MDELKQTDSVVAYNNAFNKLIMQLPNRYDEEIEYRYLKGLKRHIYTAIVSRNLTGLDALQEAATRQEQMMGHTTDSRRDYKPKAFEAHVVDNKKHNEEQKFSSFRGRGRGNQRGRGRGGASSSTPFQYPCALCNEKGHRTHLCSKLNAAREAVSKKEEANLVLTTHAHADHSIALDSCASHHVMKDAFMTENIHSIAPVEITVANNESITVHQAGTVRIINPDDPTKELVLENVLYSPNICRNLCSTIHTDLLDLGPRSTSFNGKRYILAFTDEYSRYTRIYILKNKSETREKWREFRAYAERHCGTTIKEVRCDNGGEYINTELMEELKEAGIPIITTEPYSSQQNGIAERYNRTIMDQTRAIIHESLIPQNMWNEIAYTVTYLRNRTPSSAINNDTPYHRWYGRAADTTYLRALWSEAYLHIPKQKRRSKLAPRALGPLCLIGYSDTKTGTYRLINEETKEIFESRDVTLNENNTRSSFIIDDDDEPEYQIERILDARDGDLGEKEYQVKWLGYDDPTWEPYENVKDAAALTAFTGIEDDGTPVNVNATEIHTAVGTVIPNIANVEEPTTYKQAMKSPYAREWQAAMDAELASHQKNGTWIPSDPEHHHPHVVDSKWVYKIKRNPDHSIKKFKARLVARGFTQREGIDYDETYAPVVKFNTLRMLLAIAAHYDLEIHQMDVVTAFLNGDIDADIAMKLPEGCNGGIVKLKRSLYGLKQSPRLWYKVLDTYLQKRGFIVSEFDSALYIKNNADGTFIFIAVYVDDLTIVASDIAERDTIKAAFKARFAMEDLGE
ncbi:DNA-directed DNA polymerase, partial [Powellomyces hirtus]